MNTTTIFYILFLILNTISVVVYKYANQKIGFEMTLPFIIKWLFNPLIFFSLLMALPIRFIFYKLVGDWGLNRTTLYTGALSTIFILMCGIWLFGEEMNLKQGIGAVLIIIGSILL